MGIRRYLSLWKSYMKLNFKYWMEYRSDFLIGTVGMFISNASSIIFFWAIFQSIPEINGWSFGQLVFLVGFQILTIGIWHMFFEGISPWRIDRYIREGDFDRVLLRPFNSFVSFMISALDLDASGDVIAGILIILSASGTIGFEWNVVNTLLFFVLLASSVIMMSAIIATISTLSFWIVRSQEISNTIFHFLKFVEFPMEIYSPIITFLLTFILPLGFINYYPTDILLGKGFMLHIAYLTPLISIIYLIGSYKFWKFGLTRYSSTGS